MPARTPNQQRLTQFPSMTMIMNEVPIDPRYHVTSPANSLDEAYVALSYSHHETPAGWTMFIHPRGWVYFRSEMYNAVVDEDIRSPDALAAVTDHCLRMGHLGYHYASGVEICVMGAPGSFFNLVVDHNQCVAYHQVEEPSSVCMPHDLSVSTMLRRRRYYWDFIQHHPVHIALPPHAFDEAVGTLRAYLLDNLVGGKHSVVPFSTAECENLLRVLIQNRGLESTDGKADFIAIVAWVLQHVYSHRKAERYGQFTYTQLHSWRETYRLPQYIPPQPTTALGVITRLFMNFPCFGIPHTYLEHMQSATEYQCRLSGLQQLWGDYFQQLVREYSDFALIAAVLLIATVGLLSAGDLRQAAKVLSIIAAFSALGSITIGMFFVWRHRTNMRATPSKTYAYFNDARNSMFGLNGHAIFMSLPAVLLTWSLGTFAAAIMAFTLQDVTGKGHHTHKGSTFAVVGIFAVIMLVVFVGVYAFSVVWKWLGKVSAVGILGNLVPVVGKGSAEDV